jgi:hypothetical protein
MQEKLGHHDFSKFKSLEKRLLDKVGATSDMSRLFTLEPIVSLLHQILSFLCKPAGKGKSNNDVATPSHKQMH